MNRLGNIFYFPLQIKTTQLWPKIEVAFTLIFCMENVTASPDYNVIVMSHKGIFIFTKSLVDCTYSESKNIVFFLKIMIETVGIVVITDLKWIKMFYL